MFSQEILNAVELLCVDLKKDYDSKPHVFDVAFTFEVNRTYIRVVRSDSVSSSVWGFVDKQGNVLKAKSWKAPSKTINGNVLIKKQWFYISSSSTY
ncbi:MAG: DUF7717 family protein [Culicoidibacterales bacterium]